MIAGELKTKLYYRNGQAVLPEQKIKRKGSRLYYICNTDGSLGEQVFTANAIAKKKLKYADGRVVGPEIKIQQRGRNYFITLGLYAYFLKRLKIG